MALLLAGRGCVGCRRAVGTLPAAAGPEVGAALIFRTRAAPLSASPVIRSALRKPLLPLSLGSCLKVLVPNVAHE